MSRSADLANGIVTVLGAASLPMNVSPKRRAVPILATDSELRNVTVSVFTGSKATNTHTRAVDLKTYKPLVHVAKKLASGDEATRLTEVDALLDLVDAIELAIDNTAVSGFEFMRFDEEQDRDVYNADLLKAGCFSALVVLEYWGE